MSKVSVIIPTYNNPNQLKRALNSVFKQTYNNIEIIVVNDGSTVDYDFLIKKMKQISPFDLFYFYKINEGPGIARQYGLDRASGIYFQYLDSDDEILAFKLEFQVMQFENNPDIIMTYGISMRNNNPEKTHRNKVSRKKKDDLLKNVLQIRKWHTSSCLWKYEKGIYWEKLFNGEDVLHDFNVAISQKSEVRVLFTKKILSNINTDNPEGGLSKTAKHIKYHTRIANDMLKLNKQMLIKLKKMGLYKDIYRNPLAERMLYSSLRLSIIDFNKESKTLNKLARKTTTSLVKKIELLILLFVSKLPRKRKIYIFSKYFLIRRKLLNSNIHQYRNI